MTKAGAPFVERDLDEARATGSRWSWVWLAAAAAASVLVRLPFVAAPADPDEGGFLQVAGQWSPGGGSLYGHYWVDRPPLLIALYQLADLGGGLVALRLLGCIAAGATVLLAARTAATLAGPRAGAWAAVAAAAMLVSPLMGSLEVNGELLAAPFVAGGIACLVEATHTRNRARAVLLSAVAGAAGMCSVLVKQNMFDVVVFGAVLLWVGARTGRLTGARGLGIAAIAGGGAAGALIAGWTAACGTSLVGVFDAMYPFRWHAAQVVAAGGSQYASGRGTRLLVAFALSGAAVLAGSLLLANRHQRDWDAPRLALLAVLGYDAFSIGLGGGYWLHYLVQLAVPLAVWAGVLVSGGARGPRLVTPVVVAASLVGLALTALHPFTPTGEEVGGAIAQVAQPGDTLTTLYGEPEVNLAAGLPSPYQYLWSLPTKTLDPQLSGLDSVLSGPTAPTWLVVAHSISTWGLDTAHTQALIAGDYHPVAEIGGQTVYLHDGTARAAPSAAGSPMTSTPHQPS